MPRVKLSEDDKPEAVPALTAIIARRLAEQAKLSYRLSFWVPIPY